MDWKIFYSDGRTYSGPPELAPKTQVQAIIVKDDLIGRRIESSVDQYIYSPERGGWRGVDKFALWEYLSEPGFKIVLFGSVMPDADFRQLWDKISKDKDLPPKSGNLRSERTP